MVHTNHARLALPALTLALALAGCAERAPREPAPKSAKPSAINVSPAAAAVLARADAVDGADDHVVSRCPGCGLAMPGDAAFALPAGEYTLHFCSDHCRDGFAEGGDSAILALEIPEGDPAEPLN